MEAGSLGRRRPVAVLERSVLDASLPCREVRVMPVTLRGDEFALLYEFFDR
jgi:hypothetical protein